MVQRAANDAFPGAHHQVVHAANAQVRVFNAIQHGQNPLALAVSNMGQLNASALACNNS